MRVKSCAKEWATGAPERSGRNPGRDLWDGRAGEISYERRDRRPYSGEAAHTGGDTMIRFENANAIMIGDYYRNFGYPFIDINNGGSLKGMLEAETRGPFKGPRAYDATGLPLHFDNQSTFKERFHLDKDDPNLLHDEITVFDHALTRPWSVDKTYRRNPNPYPNFSRISCMEGTNQVVIDKENYFLSADGLLMPAKKDQAPPDLRYFKQTRK